jgi:hypothetical protein
MAPLTGRVRGTTIDLDVAPKPMLEEEIVVPRLVRAPIAQTSAIRIMSWHEVARGSLGCAEGLGLLLGTLPAGPDAMRALGLGLWVVIACGCGGQSTSGPPQPSTVPSLDGSGPSPSPEDGAVQSRPDAGTQPLPDGEVPSLNGGPPRVCTAPDAGGGDAFATAPLYHRVADACCPGDRPPGDTFMTGNAGTCMTDFDCTAGVNGRCTAVQTFDCTYDTCFEDSDCPPRTPCTCRPAALSKRPNGCATGSNCAMDSDCGSGGYCSPSPSPKFNCYNYAPLYYCHTPQDECTNDSDCAVDSGQLGPNLCQFDTQSQHWKCGAMICLLP